MKTINYEDYTTKTEGAEATKAMLLDNGFTIIQSDKYKEWFTYMKDNKFGSFSYSSSAFRGVNISSEYKPSKKHGTGHSYIHEVWKLTLEDFERSLNFKCPKGMELTLEEYLKSHFMLHDIKVTTKDEVKKGIDFLDSYYIYIDESHAPTYNKNHSYLWDNLYEKRDKKKCIYRLVDGKLEPINTNLSMFENETLKLHFKNRILGE